MDSKPNSASGEATSAKKPTGLGGSAMPSLPARPAKRTTATSGSASTAVPAEQLNTNVSNAQQSSTTSTSTLSSSGHATHDAPHAHGTAPATEAAAAAPAGQSKGPKLPARATKKSSSHEEQQPHKPTLPPQPQKAQAGPSAGQAAASGATAAAANVPAAPAASSSSPQAASAKPSRGSAFMPQLPARPALPPPGPVLDPNEPEELQTLRRRIHSIRVSLIRAAQRLGYDHDNGLVKQVLYRLNQAEKLYAPWRRPTKRPDTDAAAVRESKRLEAEQGSSSPLDFTIRILVIGFSGVGKTQLVHSLCGDSTCVDPFAGVSKKVQVVRGAVQGISLECIDTPGLLTGPSQAAANTAVQAQIRKAYRSYRPDLVLYVDRMDTGGRRGAELPVLQALSDALGDDLWLNTIVGLSHAGAPAPCGPKGPMAFDVWANQRSHEVQQVIRAASGDMRLMNPMAHVESHPRSRRNAEGQLITSNGIAWQPHLYLMIVSAKLLADTENLLKKQDGSAASGSAAAGGAGGAAAMMMAQQPRQLPVPFLLNQLVQFSRPLKYPNHHQIMQIRHLESEVPSIKQPKQRREAVRAVKAMVMQMKQAVAHRDKMTRSFRSATLAGGKITPEPPRLATRRPPSVHPPTSYRYRVPEATGGWLVRPTMEPHGYESQDGIDGLQMEQVSVARAPGRKEDMLSGLPYHHVLSAQVNKQQVALQGRTEASLYHDPLGRTTTSLSADVQATGTPHVGVDAMLTLRADVRRKRTRRPRNKLTAGLMVTRLAENGRLDKGPLALGARLQDGFSTRLGLPLDVAAAAAFITTRPGGSASSAAAAAAGLAGDEAEPEQCFGANVEITSELQEVLRTESSIPLAVNVNAISYKGDTMVSAAASMQLRGERRDYCGLRAQISNKGKAGLNLKAKSGPFWWTGLLVMGWPLGSLLAQVMQRQAMQP